MSLEMYIVLVGIAALIGIIIVSTWSIKGDLEKARNEIVSTQDGLKQLLQELLDTEESE